jgi:hypothetical protein
MAGSLSVEQAAEKSDALFAADVVPVGQKRLVGQDGAVSAQDDFAVRGIFSDEGHGFFHAVENGQQEGHADEIVPFLQLPDEVFAGRVLQHDGGRVQILGDIIERKIHMDGARAKNALGPGDLPVQELVPHAGVVSVFRPHRADDAGEQDFLLGLNRDGVVQRILAWMRISPGAAELRTPLTLAGR